MTSPQHFRFQLHHIDAGCAARRSTFHTPHGAVEMPAFMPVGTIGSVKGLEIEQIRGVDCAGSLKTLMDRRLVKVMGKKDVPGKPFLFGTTREFMETFSLGSLSELPSMRDIEDFLAASTGGTPLGEGRPTMHLPAIPDGGIEQGGDELAASLAEAGPAAEEAPVPEGKFPPDVTEAELSDAVSKAEGEGIDPVNGD